MRFITTPGSGESGGRTRGIVQEGRNKVADIVHRMVMDLLGHIGIFLPAVQTEFPDRMDTIAANADFPLFEGHTHLTDAIEHMVLGRDGFEGRMFLDEGTEAGSRGVHNDAPDIFIPGKLQQGSEMLVVRALYAKELGIVVILVNPVPRILEFSPKAERGGLTVP